MNKDGSGVNLKLVDDLGYRNIYYYEQKKRKIPQSGKDVTHILPGF
jgi:hypothetical protein